MIVLLAAAALLVPAAPAAEGGRLTVAVGIAPHAWLARQIGGEHVAVQTLVPPGSSHETFSPSDSDVSRFMEASIYFRMGLPFERSPWFKAIEKSGRMRIVDVNEGIELRTMEDGGCAAHHEGDDEGRSAGHEEHGHAHGGPDPHTWLTPRLLAIQAATMARAFGEADPPHRDDYTRNLAALSRRLDALDRTMHEILDPLAGGTFFVFHPAWGYLADEYRLKQVAIESGGQPPADHELTALQQKARSLGVRAVFVQPQIASRSARAVADAVGARVETIDPLAENVVENLETVARRLAAGMAPERRVEVER